MSDETKPKVETQEESSAEGTPQPQAGVPEEGTPEKMVPQRDLDALRSSLDKKIAAERKEKERALAALAELEQKMQEQAELFNAKIAHLESYIQTTLGHARPALEEIERASRLQQAIARYRQDWPEIPAEVYANCRTEADVSAAAYEYLKKQLNERKRLETEVAKAKGDKRSLGYVGGRPSEPAAPAPDELSAMRKAAKEKGVDRGLDFLLATDPTLRKQTEKGASTKV